MGSRGLDFNNQLELYFLKRYRKHLSLECKAAFISFIVAMLNSRVNR